jgi:hypothetical protein
VAVQRQAHGRSATDAEVGFGAAVAASDLDDLEGVDEGEQLAGLGFGVGAEEGDGAFAEQDVA